MGEIWGFIRSRPLLSAGIVLVGAMVLFLLSRGGNASAAPSGPMAYIPPGPSDAAIAAQASVQAATIGAQTEQAKIQGQIKLAEIASAGNLSQAQLEAQVALAAVAAQSAAANAEINAMREIETVRSADARAVALRGVEAQENVARATLTAQTEREAIQAAFMTDYATLAAETAIANNQIFAGIAQTQTLAARDVQLAYVQADLSAAAIAADVQKAAITAAAGAQQATTNAVLASLPQVKKKDRDEVLQSLITGVPVENAASPSRTAQVLGGVGDAARGIAKLFSGGPMPDIA